VKAHGSINAIKPLPQSICLV